MDKDQKLKDNVLREDVDWDQLNVKKFVATSAAPSVLMRVFTYPSWVIKTRLQVQEVNSYSTQYSSILIRKNNSTMAFSTQCVKL